MAVNKKIRRSYAGTLEILHPETTIARVKQTSSGTERSDFSKNLFQLIHDGTANRFLKIATDGVITKVSSPADFNAANEVHTHTQAQVTYVKSGVWSVTVNQAYDLAVENIACGDVEQSEIYLNTGGYQLSVNTYFTYPSGFIIRCNHPSTPTVFYYFIASYVTVPLDGYLTDNNDGKVPLSGGKIDKTYLPDYTKGHMQYVGGADLSLGVDEASAVSLSIVFSTLGTNPDQQVGNFKIVTTAGFIKGDEVKAGLGTLDAMNDEPVFLNIGDRIVFIAYNATGPIFTFAYLHNDFSVATALRKGVVQLADTAAKNRGALNTGTSGLAVVDEFALREAMRDVVYAANLKQVLTTSVFGQTYFYVYTAVQIGEPTHTSGESIATMALGADEVGKYIITSSGKVYQFTGYNPPASHLWTYVATITPPNAVPGELACNYADTSVLYVVTEENATCRKYTTTTLVEGDLLIH